MCCTVPLQWKCASIYTVFMLNVKVDIWTLFQILTFCRGG